ncbi:recombination mediator RecR [Neisseria sp. Ec49-e6-T10]
MGSPRILDALTKALRVLPAVGPKSAQRIAYHLLQNDRKGAAQLAQAINHALEHVQHCRYCNTFCETEVCEICSDQGRRHNVLMIVQMPIDVESMEDARCHDGVYFVLMGQVNPAQNMDLSAIALDKLVKRLENGQIEEIIIATNFTAEGDATAYVLSELFKNQHYKISRLARGMPLGGEIEYVDAGTLAQSVHDRRKLK